jgi:peptide/nickel transport system substrate-binding protein
MARRIRWQIVTAILSGLLIAGLLGALALRTAVPDPTSRGGVYVEGVVGTEPPRINPLRDNPQSNPIGYDLAALIFQGLMRTGDEGRPELDLAREWTVDDSGTVYTFTLPPDGRWHDGQPLTARDVVFTVGAVKAADFAGDPALATLWRSVAVEASDDYTVRFTLPAPFAPFLSAARLPIVPAHLFGGVPQAQWDAAAWSRQPVGSGPFRLEQLGPDRAVLAASASYIGQPPLLDRIELRFFPTDEAALAAFERGELDGLVYEPEEALRAAALPPGARALSLPLDGYTTLSFNTREAPTSDVGLRRALERGLDKDALVAAVGEHVARLDTPLLPGSWASDPSVRAPAYDAAAAERLLGELGYARGADGVLARGAARLALPLLTDAAPDHVAAAAEIARQWGALGVEVSVQQLDGEALRARLRAHAFVLALHSFGRLGPDPDPYELWHSSQAAEGLNYSGVTDDQLDTLIEEGRARAEPEAGLRNDDYSAFAARWLELSPALMLYQPTLGFVAAPQLGGTRLEAPEGGLPPLLFGRADRFRDIARWYVSSSRVIDGDLRQP